MAVYGSNIALPFDLRRLTLFWKPTSAWRARQPQPDISLPLANCIGRPRPVEWGLSTITARSSGIQSSQVQPRCKQCREWLLPPGSARAMRHSPTTVAVTHRTHYVEVRAVDEDANAFRQPARNSTWVEVMRSDYSPRQRGSDEGSYEGVAGYGCWLFNAVGSGLFVHVGRRSAVVADGTAMAERAVTGPLMQEYVASGHRVDDIPSPRGPFKELYPYAAHELGYDSIQVLSRRTETPGLVGPGEIVLTNEACSHARSPIRACLPPDVDVMTGTTQQLQCFCEQRAHGLLNCARGRMPKLPESFLRKHPERRNYSPPPPPLRESSFDRSGKPASLTENFPVAQA